jgi:uncharacterized membrane protein YkvA (DUF1232 family)
MAQAPRTIELEPEDESPIWRKILRFGAAAGREVVERALQLHYAARDPRTPAWARRVMYGALAYFIMPIDAIPDFIPGIGYTDDLGVLATALLTVAFYVTPEVKARARATRERWLGG